MNTLILVCKEGPPDRDRKRENPGGRGVAFCNLHNNPVKFLGSHSVAGLR